MKPQYVDQIPKALKGTDRSVEALLKARSQMDNFERILDVLGMNGANGYLNLSYGNIELHQVLDRDIDKLSGGELQRFAIGIVCVQQADVYDLYTSLSSYRLIISAATCSTSRLPTSM